MRDKRTPKDVCGEATFWLANFKCGVSFCAPDRAHKKALMSEDLVIQGQSHLQLVGRNCIL